MTSIAPATTALTVRVGHIGAMNAMPNSDKILEIAQLDAVAKMAAYWNVPIIGYMASATAFVDKTIYKTLARVSLRTTNSLAGGVAALLRHFSALAFERVVTFEETFKVHGVSVAKKVSFDEYTNAKAIVDSGLLNELANNARIIVCIFSSTREMTKEFLQAIHNVGMNTNDYVYLLPWLQTEKKDKSPWIGGDGEMLQNVKELFANTIIVDDVNGFDDTLVTPFKERIEASGLTVDDLDLVVIHACF
uniref:Receptor ligand binding region domain-containing protein n=1 Tax=Parascaris univalens TaxID=6257 RepID=A0A915CIF0_PARUN